MSDNYFNSFDELPIDSNTQLWADFIELNCLVSRAEEITVADIYDLIDNRKGSGEIEMQDFGYDNLKDQSDGYSNSGEIFNKTQFQIETYFEILKARNSILDSAYPFKFRTNGIKRLERISNDQLTSPHFLYIFLLLASNLRYIKKNKQQIVTDSFESICLDALKECLPQQAQAHLFSTKNKDIRSKYAGNNVWNKILLLGKDLGLRILGREEDFSKFSTGENGADIVAWVPTGDELDHKLMFFCQCTCQVDLSDPKRFSSSPSQWKSVFDFQSTPSNIFFIPHFFKKANGSWENLNHISDVIFFDRSRLCWILRDENQLDNYGANTLVQNLLQQQEDLF